MRGDGRTISGLRRLLADIRTGSPTRPDLIVVGIDADCSSRGERDRQVRRACELEGYEGDGIVAEPDPHIEIWYLADPVLLQQLLQTPSLSLYRTFVARRTSTRRNCAQSRCGGAPPAAPSSRRGAARGRASDRLEMVLEVRGRRAGGGCAARRSPSGGAATGRRALEGYEGDGIVAEPDPHIEIWYLADPVLLQQLLQTPSLSLYSPRSAVVACADTRRPTPFVARRTSTRRNCAQSRCRAGRPHP